MCRKWRDKQAGSKNNRDIEIEMYVQGRSGDRENGKEESKQIPQGYTYS